MQRTALLLALLLSCTSAFLQNPICASCSGGNTYGSYSSYPNISPNPLAYFNGPTDFGNQLGKAIAASISDLVVITPKAHSFQSYSSGYSSSSSQPKLTFGSYPQSGLSTQTYGGANDYGPQTYVIQPDLYGGNANSYGGQTYGNVQTYGSQGGYENQGYGNQGGYTFSSFPNNNGYGNQYIGQPATSYGLSNYGNMATNYGNNYPTNTYGVPDPITTGGVSTGNVGSCPYCFGNKGGYKTKKAKRESKSKKD
ncbi:unnamed protein product [Strongylus vulgaris]|uniref:Uncharacterized protein n=1 Tax=Strongylus vulgaris TaxID=40348 RepID=A0A3P7LAQ6_STRVU|nr:unnamed protein product [Strongylus vulgaris]